MPVTADPTEVSKSFAQRRVAILFALNDEAFGLDDFVGDKFNWGVVQVPIGPAGRCQSVAG